MRPAITCRLLLVKLYTIHFLEDHIFFPVILVIKPQWLKVAIMIIFSRWIVFVVTRGDESSLNFPRLYSSEILVLGNRTSSFPPSLLSAYPEFSNQQLYVLY